MVVFVTSRGDATADYFGAHLTQRKVPFCRLDSDDLYSSLRVEWSNFPRRVMFSARGKEAFSASDITGLWFRRPKAIRHPARPATAESRHAALEFTAAAEAMFELVPTERWINYPANNVRASHKLEQLSRAAEFGLRVPRTLVTQSPKSLRAFWRACGGRVIAKPMASGYIQRKNSAADSLIYTSRVQAKDLADASTIRACPTLFQEEVRKVVDVRITVIDQTYHAVGIEARDAGSPRLDIRRDEMRDVRYSLHSLPSAVRRSLARYLRSYRLRFAAVDMCVDTRGRWHFLEVNPNGQWAWLDLCGVTRIADSLEHALVRPIPA